MSFKIIICCLFFACNHLRDNHESDLQELTAIDYRVFQNTPVWDLARAIRDNDIIQLRELASKNKLQLNYQEPKFGSTLLIISVRNEQFDAVKTLLDQGADPNIHDTYNGSSAIIEACSLKDNVRFADLFLKYGANVNDIQSGVRREGNSTRFTPLMAASWHGNLNIIRFLVSNRADVNYINEFHQSAISSSVLQENYEITLYLLNNGADYKIPMFRRVNPDVNVYLVDVLREDLFDLDSDKYKLKMKIVEFLRSKGIEYRNAPIPDYIRAKIIARYGDTWQNYLNRY